MSNDLHDLPQTKRKINDSQTCLSELLNKPEEEKQSGGTPVLLHNHSFTVDPVNASRPKASEPPNSCEWAEEEKRESNAI